MNIKNTCIIAASAMLLIASQPVFAKENLTRLAKLYDKAVDDASLAEDSEISQQLTVISSSNQKLIWNDDNSKVLVATWKSKTAFDQYIAPYNKTSDNEQYVTWVTAVPEVQEFCQAYTQRKKKAGAAKLDKRLKQHLGLNTTWDYDVFVEMWVSPDDLFRPCTDPEITDASCNLNFDDSLPEVKNIKNYKRFYQNLYYSSFRSPNNIVPWAGLGYTYDWANNQTDVGASEFIIVPKGEYEIHRVATTAQYCHKA